VGLTLAFWQPPACRFWTTIATLHTIGMPDRLDGIRVLDVGAWDGFSPFEAERRGAAQVVATDDFCRSGPGWGTEAGFDLAHQALGSKVQSREIGVLELHLRPSVASTSSSSWVCFTTCVTRCSPSSG
jgi:hypothetical protein